MQINTLKDLYLFGIQHMNNGCGASLSDMRAMRDAATHPDLRSLLDHALGAMDHSLQMFDTILTRHGVTADNRHNRALTALGAEGRELGVDAHHATSDLRDLAIVAKVRNLAHYPEAGFSGVRRTGTRPWV